jgi:hypothetical protein
MILGKQCDNDSDAIPVIPIVIMNTTLLYFIRSLLLVFHLNNNNRLKIMSRE